MKSVWKDLISEENIIKWRRHFHKYPELSFHEKETSQFIYDTLCSFSYFEVTRPTKYSVLAIKRSVQKGKVVAIRADIDALPIQEETLKSYASVNKGIMHACGHDAHAAILLSVAETIANIKEEFVGEVRLFFQHAEEVYPGGGQEMVEAGVMDGVDYVIGLHVMSGLESGKIGIVYGPMMAAPDVFTVEINGKGGHAARPEETVDPIAIGAQIVTNLQHIVSRNTSAFMQRVVSVTQFHGGMADNIIPNGATLMGTVRSFNQTLREEAKEKVEQIVKGITEAHGGDYTYTYRYGYDPVINNEYITKIVEESAMKLFGNQRIVHLEPSMGGEDFSAYLRKAPGCFIKIGTGNKSINTCYPHHHPKFDVDESALIYGVELFLETTIRLLETYKE
ncbi:MULTISPECIES: amidohydrolase [Bacillus cereus group]|uniref:N-acyl-L-amino acid amidohydrolase n=1 Tax=Bacillus cereus TaxID=1396 RepID=A0A2B8T651_BACCE|nr:amidohydrolase [Bacillus cereus]PDY81273.1 N-acyl-L-amino acid amidohydrolase [Bacillus cereus]PFA15076.1 N-acyl-L-amino acid amidohydrolase [Bacillus cereus]PFM42802.1 N-acyl-L-amino acid amidohydrolase [Bacillus cereus]PGL60255.1 N-acyl-L-amino acid amidohydrolase [Bacillus cereus]PGQ05546.1 N-acyl-L-amino acid amidohydrolase [Bacillus cereus]